jgi:hypothetical protein
MSWGNKLLITFIIFGSGMIYLVYRCMNTEFELVEKDYYKNELAYQQVIDASERTGKLSSVVKITQTAEELRLEMPDEMKGKHLTGEVWFYCAYDSRKDKKMSLELDGSGIQRIPSSILSAGRYQTKISWNDNGDRYYQELYIDVR